MMLFRRQCTGFPVQCCLESLGQHCTGFLPVQCCPKNITTTLNRFFHVQCCLEPLGQHCTRFLPVQCSPKCIKTTSNKSFFLCNVIWSILDDNAQDFYLYNVVPRELRQHWKVFFSCAMLPGASWTTLHKVFTCAMSSEEY